MTDLLFDTPWWLPAIIAVAGVMTFFSGNNRGQDKVRNAGVGVVLLALALMAVSYFVDTDREKVLDRTTAMVDAIEAQDWAKFEALLDERSSFMWFSGRARLAKMVRDKAQDIGLKKAYVVSQRAVQTETLITVTMDTVTEQDRWPGPMRSQWEIDWQQRGDQWLLYKVTPLSVGGQPGEVVGRHLPANN